VAVLDVAYAQLGDTSHREAMVARAHTSLLVGTKRPPDNLIAVATALRADIPLKALLDV